MDHHGGKINSSNVIMNNVLAHVQGHSLMKQNEKVV